MEVVKYRDLHPRLERVYYVKLVAARRHSLFEYDLASKQSRQVFAHTGEAFLFDWTPDGSRLVFASNRHGSKEGETNVFIADWK